MSTWGKSQGASDVDCMVVEPIARCANKPPDDNVTKSSWDYDEIETARLLCSGASSAYRAVYVVEYFPAKGMPSGIRRGIFPFMMSAHFRPRKTSSSHRNGSGPK